MPTSALLTDLSRQLDQQGIRLVLHKKQVKNINFRLTAHSLTVSAPKRLTDDVIAAALAKHLDWVIKRHQSLLLAATQVSEPTLWGAPTSFENEAHQLSCYRSALNALIPELCATWQPIVGKSVQEVRLKKMSTRWGTCNVRERRIWLSVYLAAYPVECTHYVFVHELCHLHHANHSPRFWACVADAMPDYQHWHQLLRQRQL